MAMNLPRFPCHPDLVSTGSVVAVDTPRVR